MLYTWNENTPADTDLISGGDDIIRELKKAIRERLDVEHVFTTGNEADVGKHNAGFITEANGYLGDASVVTAKIKDVNVTTPKIADLNVTEAKLADSAVATAKIADGAVTTPKILDAAVTTPKITDSAVTLIKIAPTARGPGSTLDADTVDGIHASGLAPASEGVLNGNQHNHEGGDGAQIDHGSLAGLGDDDHPQYETSAEAQARVDAHDALQTVAHGLAAGVYSPSFAIDANLSSAVIDSVHHYIRIGNQVFVTGSAIIDPIATGGIAFRVSLPIASDFTTSDQAVGVVTGGDGSATWQINLVSAPSSNDVQITMGVSSTTAMVVFYSFMYTVL